MYNDEFCREKGLLVKNESMKFEDKVIEELVDL
jgi:hypothetical protein